MMRLTTPLRRFNTYSRALLAPANKYGPDGKKLSTGITGLPVIPHARNVLIALYNKTLEEVKVLPEKNHYRKAVESITKFRLAVVMENECIQKIEDVIDNGQVEELIDFAESELELIPYYAKEKPWIVKSRDEIMEEEEEVVHTISPEVYKDPYRRSMLLKNKEEELETAALYAELDKYEEELLAKAEKK